MAVNSNWPLVVTQVAFNSAPNDPAAVPTWVDLSARLEEFGCSAGRQYEIDQNQAGEADAVFLDKDEALNPANAASPYAPNVLPYRQIIQQAMWPPAPVGSAVNLLNSVAGYDPSMEATPVGTTPWSTAWFNVTAPVASTLNPRTGSRSMQWAVVSGGGGQYVGIGFLAIPGRQYTISVYVRQSAANTVISFINGGASGSSTSTTGAYVRLTCTFTATQPTHVFYVGSTAPGNNATCTLDDWQLEVGAAASTWNVAGPVIYGVFRGYVERWPAEWNHNGLYGMCNVSCVDALAVLAQTELHTELINAMLATAPAYLWRLNESDGAVNYADSSGNFGPSLARMDGPYGPADTFEPGTQMPIPGDPGATGVSIFAADAFPQPASVLQAGAVYTAGAAQQVSIGASSLPFGYTVAFVAVRTANNDGRMFLLSQADFNVRFAEVTVSTTPDVAMLIGPASGFSLGVFTANDSWADGKPHLYVMTVAAGVASTDIVGYVDGVNVGTSSLSPFAVPAFATQVQIGGLVANLNAGTWSGEVNRGVDGGIFSALGLWRRALTAAEVTKLSQGFAGFPGETSGARVARYLGYGYSGATSIDTGASIMGVSAAADGTALLDALQGVANTENGNLVADRDGIVTFTSRTARYLTTTARWTLGELASSGEAPYEQGIKFDFDPSRVANRITITRTGGVIAVAADATSKKAYFERKFDREINVAGDAEAYDAAAWYLAQMKDPHVRVASIELKPSANPALWPVALGIAIGDRVTVKRRAITGGLTMSLDFFVEKISHSHAAGEWTTTLELSPATGRTPWILQDATYGLLGSTTVLGY